MDTGIREMSSALWMFLLMTTILAAIIFNIRGRLNLKVAFIFLLIYAVFVFYIFGQAFNLDFTGSVSDVLSGVIESLESLF